MAARKEKQPAPAPEPAPVPAAIPSTYNRKVLAAAILIVGLIVAVAVSKFQLGPQPVGENAPPDPSTTSDLGDPGEIDESPPVEDLIVATEVGDLSQVRSREQVETLPPAPEVKKSNASKKQAPVRGPPEQKSQSAKPRPQAEAKKAAPKTAPKSAPLGKLVEVAKDTYRSSAGLVYGPGSQEGNRVKHVMKHAVDDPQRPIHGVFDGKQDEIFAVIDEAWLIAKKGGKGFTVEYQDNRAVYLVDLGRRIGYIGGKTGKRLKNPAAQHLRLVLERQNVITAFPDRP